MTKKQNKPNEFEKFDSTMRKLMSVSHDAIKAVLDSEKQTKKKRSKKKDK